MPRKTAAQGDGKDSGVLLIDDRTKAVMTDQPRHAQEAFREQIARVHEVVPSRSRDDVALVLQYHEGNVDKAIQSFMEDGAKTVLNEWQSHGKKGKSASKRNKKKKRGPDTQDEKPSGVDTAPPNKTGGASSTTQATNSHPAPTTTTRPSNQQRPPSSQQPRQYQQQPNRRDRDHGDHNRGRPHPRGHPGEGRGGEGSRPGRQQPGNQAASNHLPSDSGKPRSEKGHRSHHTPPHDDMIERLLPKQTDQMVHHADSELHYQDAAKAKKLVAVLERSTKDLHRTSIALTRHKAMLQDKLDQSEKSIPKSFDEVQRFLNERKLALTNEFLEVKQEATDMLEAREEKAKELVRKTHRAPTMSEEQVQELRAEIKQFVSDRKVDEEIGKALRYTWNPDKLIELIKSFGEVIPVQHHYTSRRPSISSLSSFNTISRTTSVSEDHGPLSARSISLTESQDSVTKPLSPRRTNDIDMKAEVAEMAAKLQRSMTQGRKGARNQGGQNPDNQNKGERSEQPHRSQGQGQQPHSNQGQGGPNPNKQGRNQNRQDRPQGQHGSRQGQQGSKQGQHPQEQKPQGQRPQGQRPQGQRPQGQGQRQQQRNVNEEQDGQKKENRNAKRRQTRKQKERKQIDTEEAPSAQASNGTTGASDKPEKKQVDERTNQSSNVPVSVPTPVNTPQPAKAPEAVPEPKEANQEKEKIVQDSVSVPAPAEAPQPSKVPEEVLAPQETEREKQEIKKDNVDDSNVNEIEKPESLDSKEKDMDKLNEGVKDVLKPKMTNGPLKNGDVNMNGDIKINGDVPHVNGDILPNDKINGSIEDPLPQREIKSRRSHKIEGVVKENSTLNGVAEFEPTEREN